LIYKSLNSRFFMENDFIAKAIGEAMKVDPPIRERYGAYSIKRHGFRIYPYFPRTRGWFFRACLIYVFIELRVWDRESEREFRVIGQYPIITSPLWFLRKKDKYIQEALEWTIAKLEELAYQRFNIFIYPEEWEEYFSGDFDVLDWKFLGIYCYFAERMTKEERERVLEEFREHGIPSLERVI